MIDTPFFTRISLLAASFASDWFAVVQSARWVGRERLTNYKATYDQYLEASSVTANNSCSAAHTVMFSSCGRQHMEFKELLSKIFASSSLSTRLYTNVMAESSPTRI